MKFVIQKRIQNLDSKSSLSKYKQIHSGYRAVQQNDDQTLVTKWSQGFRSAKPISVQFLKNEKQAKRSADGQLNGKVRLNFSLFINDKLNFQLFIVILQIVQATAMLFN